MNTEKLGSLVYQHARTAQLLGVDFVPCYRSGEEAEGEHVCGELLRPEDESMTRVTKSAGSKQAQLDMLLERYIAEAPHDKFGYSFTNIVFGEGDPDARLMFVGEAPGAEEDKTGRPFVGRGGQLLEKMIVAMGLSRAEVYIANVLKVRPPNNATPTTEETKASSKYLFEQIRIIEPDVIVTLGKPAGQLLLDTDETMGRMRARWWELTDPQGGRSVPVMPTYHPAFLLRQYTEENRAKVWSDLQQVMTRLGLKGLGGE